MSSNNEIIQKADFALADLASGGALNEEQSSSFIRKLISQPTLLNGVRTVTMNSPQRQINKIGFGKRILRKGTSGVALDTAAVDGAFNATAEATARAKPTTSQVLLSTNEVLAEIRIPYDVIEDNIERGNINAAGANSSAQPIQGGLKDTIISMIAERAALDLEELAINGDTAVVGSDPYLGMVDGFLTQSTSNVVAAGGPATRTMFKNGLKTMPDQYLRNRSAMRHYVSHDNEIEYRDTLAQRETAGGDGLIQGYAPVYAFGVPVEPVALMPEAQGIFTFPQNMIFGIQRQISIEVDKIITERVFVIVLTARIDFKVEEEEAIVKYNGIA
ncbi:MAG: hypothetical protein GQ570_03845 [Helicobacteraceae bacterium]|nr:hypothetical protein [Helicobacteraceae bacterium]